MKRVLIIISCFVFIVGSACKKTGYQKPENLIPEKQMVDILYDIHINESAYNQKSYVTDSITFSKDDLHFSILKKHGVEDSLFIKSVLYYSSMPKMYERIYKGIVEKLVILEEDLNKDEAVKIQQE